MRILVVDDDRAVRESLRRSLAFNGYQVELASDGQAALDAVLAQRPDAMVLDVMMPRLDGLEVCRRMRAAGDDAADPRAHRPRRGLRPGGRASTPAPTTTCPSRSRSRSCSPGCARCCAGARPTTIAAAAGQSKPLEFADLTLDPDTREVRRGDRPISLTRTEFSLLELLLTNPRRVLTRAQILEQVWGYDFPTTGNALEVYIGYLRRKTEADGEPRLIHTVRGVGYVLRDTPP